MSNITRRQFYRTLGAVIGTGWAEGVVSYA